MSVVPFCDDLHKPSCEDKVEGVPLPLVLLDFYGPHMAIKKKIHRASLKKKREFTTKASGFPHQNKFTQPKTEATGALFLPEILAPAGDTAAALAAYAAGADAVYLGLKHFSARMQAENFSITELARLANFAHSEQRRVYVAMNTLLKPNDPAHALRLIRRLALDVSPDALIIQDPGLIPLAKEAGFLGEIHLSTLANVTHQKALSTAAKLGAARVILPRELSLDEVRLMNDGCPQGVNLELFVHGALCYCVSGRCWWSSYMGGKSGLRGRCVQPCRRVYKQRGREGRFFSSLDLSLDSLVRHLLPLENVRSWKIEGRRKGPHYVYHVTAAYKLLRDEGGDASVRREAERLLEYALGRPFTKSLFTSQKGSSLVSDEQPSIKGGATVSPVQLIKGGQTSSGLLVGKTFQSDAGKYVISPRIALLPKDSLRIGYEDEPWHSTVFVSKKAAEGTPYSLFLPRGKHPKPGTPVFLMDRKEPALLDVLDELQRKLQKHSVPLKSRDEDIMALHPRVYGKNGQPVDGKIKGKNVGRLTNILLRSSLPKGKEAKDGLKPGVQQGQWLSQKALSDISKTLYGRISWWLPPVIWPNEDMQWDRLIAIAYRSGARQFVCNAPWQQEFFIEREGVSLIAGPFCNIANAAALAIMASLGFNAAIISPELGQDDILALPGQSPLPLGMVTAGFWPMGISRHTGEPLKSSEGFQSPKGEEFWMRRYGQNTWVYPAWPLDITAHIPRLTRAGYSFFVTMQEFPPKGMPEAKRASEFNWTGNVL